MDNCPNTYNPDQKDSNHNGIGDVCDAVIVIPPTPIDTTPIKPPVINSNTYVAYLDFDGYYSTSPYWNGGVPIQLDSSGMAAANITYAVNIVKKNYNNYNILITTDSTVYKNADAFRRIRIVITKTCSWYSCGISGVAYIGSLTWGDDTPGFVFSGPLNLNGLNVGRSICHELGHTVGLNHQSSYDTACNLVAVYNGGTNLLAPIMGNSLNSNSESWWIGPMPYGCTMIQNDTLVLKNTLGNKL